MINMYRSDVDEWLWWLFEGVGDATFPWRRILSGEADSSDVLRIYSTPAVSGRGVAIVDLFDNGSAGLDRTKDHVIFSESDHFDVAIQNVEYVTAAADKVVDLFQLDHFGFTTDGSIRFIEADVGNHLITYETAARDSFLSLGTGFDRVILADDPDVGNVTYWTVRREFDNSVVAYALSTGHTVELKGDSVSRYATNNGVNYGEVERLTYSDFRTNGDVDLYLPRGDINDPYNRSGFENIDLNKYDLSDPIDTFLHASFGSINFSSRNVFVGAAVVEEWNGTEETAERQSEAYRYDIDTIAPADHNHDLYVYEQGTALDGHLRLYVRDETSRTYNRFNEVFLGSSGADNDINTGSTSDRNGTGQLIVHTAMYGFGGNDTLTAGGGNDFLFGGESTYSIRDPNVAYSGNRLTGGDGADHFGVGNVTDLQDGDLIMSTDFAGRMGGAAATGEAATLSGSGANEAADLATRVATDRIQDWTSGVDFLRVLPNGTAIIEGLGTANGSGTGGYVKDLIGTQAERIDVSGARSQVNNEGKIVLRGRDGNDTIIGSGGDDWIYGNAGVNVIDLSPSYTSGDTTGGQDRVYVDTFNPGGVHVAGFDSNDKVYLNQEIVGAFATALGSSLNLQAGAQAITSSFTSAVNYDDNINFMHSLFYNRKISDPATNAQHTAADGSFIAANDSADSITFGIGLGMVIAGEVLRLYFPPAGEILRATGAALGGLGGSGIVPTIAHQNATISGAHNHFVNVLNNNAFPSTTVVAETGGTYTVNASPSTVRFLDFFANTTTSDGFTEVLEFTDSFHQTNGVYGYFAVKSNNETFVYLVASKDNLVENNEAFKVAELNGTTWTSANFESYVGGNDIYNAATVDEIKIVTPAISSVTNNSVPVTNAGSTDLAAGDNLVVNIAISGGATAGSTLQLYDGLTAIGSPIALAVNDAAESIIDTRGLGTIALNSTNADDGNDTYFLQDSEITYRAVLTDANGYITRTGTHSVTVSGGDAAIDGGGGNDTLIVEETSNYLNGLTDEKLEGFETILLSPPSTDEKNPGNAGILLDLALQDDGFEVIGGAGNDTIIGSTGDDVIAGAGGDDTIYSKLGADKITGGSGVDTFVYTARGDSYYDLMDEITDFEFGVSGDVLDLDAIDGAGDVAYTETSFSSLNSLIEYAKRNHSQFTSNDDIETFVGLVDGEGAYVLIHSGDMQNWSTTDADSAIIHLSGVASLSNIVGSNFASSDNVYKLPPVVGGNLNVTNFQYDANGDGVYGDDPANQTISVGNKFKDLSIISYSAGEQIPIPATFGGYGNDVVDPDQFEVFYGTVDAGLVFTVTGTPAFAPGTVGATHTLILYDNDSGPNANFLDGFAVVGIFPESGWEVLNPGTANAVLVY